MVKMTQSLFQYLWDNHRELISLVSFGHIEVLTDEIWSSYIEWCKTDEGRKYLNGGSEYKEKYENGI